MNRISDIFKILPVVTAIFLAATACRKPSENSPENGTDFKSGSESFSEDAQIKNDFFDDTPFSDPKGPEDLDFSRVGYRHGDAEIPTYRVGRSIGVNDIAAALASGEVRDTTEFIQIALSRLTKGTALLLKAGEYNISRSIEIMRSGIVIRGEGAGKTILRPKFNQNKENPNSSVFVVGPTPKGVSSNTVDIIDEHVPVGAMYVNVKDPSGFEVGDNVLIYRPATLNWIEAIRMDENNVVESPSREEKHWWGQDYKGCELEMFDIKYERTVVGIHGSRIYFDNPVCMDIDKEYGGATLSKYSLTRISECGIENMSIEAVYDPSIKKTYKGIEYDADENHAISAVSVRATENCWIKGITSRNMRFACVSMGAGARLNTVTDCHSEHPVSEITGSRRYAFNLSLATACLVKDCTADHDRHMFVTANRSNGPHVFLRCTATNCYSNAGPHCYWATMILYDNVVIEAAPNGESILSVEDPGQDANYSYHGWQGANHVFWNCTAEIIACQSPWVTAKNYAYGCVGKKVWGTRSINNLSPLGQDSQTWTKTSNWRPDGQWYPVIGGGDYNTIRMTDESLYEKQLAERHSKGIYLN